MKIDVCLSPELIQLYELKGKVVVVVDILRATSCMVTGIAHGVEHIYPVATLDECHLLRKNGYVGAAERDGLKADGFELGNSPFSYMEPELKGKKIAVTTTNGTIALTRSKAADAVVVGAFLNIGYVKNYILSERKDVLVVCAGWKGKVNLEDTLFAGALVEMLKADFSPACDAPLMAQTLFLAAKNDLYGFLQNSSHVNRLRKLNIEEDIKFCPRRYFMDGIP